MSDFENLKIRFNLSIGYYGANRDEVVSLSDYIDEETWNEMNESEKEKFIDEITEDWSLNYIELSGWVE